jgi:hypothetical protein
MCVDGRIVFAQLTQQHVTEICATSINETATAALGSFSTSNASSEFPDHIIVKIICRKISQGLLKILNLRKKYFLINYLF